MSSAISSLAAGGAQSSSSARHFVSGSRRAEALRSVSAHAALAECHFCAHHCGVNRLAGELGPCRAGPHARIFSLAEQGKAALAKGARTIMILGGEPTIHLPMALEIAAAMPEAAKLVWKTNAHGSPQARDLLDGVFDVWLADYKFGNDDCARRLAKIPDYGRTVRENLLWAAEHSELIVRHLVMPGHLDCCWRPVAEWLATELPGVKVSLRTGFWPAWRSARHVELRRTVSTGDSQYAFQIAAELGLNLIP